MREYETTYILNPSLTDSDVKVSVDKVSEIIKRHEGSVLRQQLMGKRSLAYRIKKQSKGHYVYFDYSGDTKTVSELEHIFRLDEQVMRYLTVKLSDKIDVEARKQQIQKEAEDLAKAMAAATALTSTGIATEPAKKTVFEDDSDHGGI